MAGDTTEINYLLAINEKLTEEISFLRDQIRQLMEMNRELLGKINTKTEKTPVNESHDWNPVGGYKSLREKIEEAEQASRREFETIQESSKDD